MGISLGGAVGDLLNNYVSGQQRQQAIQRQVQQQTLENAIQQQRQDAMNAQSAREAAAFPGQQQEQQLDLAMKMQALLNSGAVPMGGAGAPTGAPMNASTGTPALNAGQQSLAPPQVAPQAPQGPDDPTSDLDTTATPPAASAPGTLGAAVTGLLPIGSVGGVAYGMTPGMSAPAKRLRAISAVQTEFQRMGQTLTDDQASALVDGPPAVLDTQLRLAQQANAPDKGSAPITPFEQAQLDLRKQEMGSTASNQAAQLALAQRKLADAEAKGATTPAQQAFGTLLPSLEADHAQINALGTPNIAASIAGKMPLVGNWAEGKLSPAVQEMAALGNDWTLHYMQGLKSARMSVPTLAFINKTYVPQSGDSDAVIATKNAARERAMVEIRAKAAPTVTNPFMEP